MKLFSIALLNGWVEMTNIYIYIYIYIYIFGARSFGTCMCGKVRQTGQGVGCYIKKTRHWNVKGKSIIVYSHSKKHQMYSEIQYFSISSKSNFAAASNRLYYYPLFFYSSMSNTQ